MDAFVKDIFSMADIALKYWVKYVGAFSTCISTDSSSALLVLPIEKARKYDQEDIFCFPSAF